MSTISHTPTEMIQDIEKHGSNLSEWEIDFVDSIDKQMGKGKSLTRSQIQTLETIHEDRVG